MTAMIYGSDGYPIDTPESEKTKKIKEVNLPIFVFPDTGEVTRSSRISDRMSNFESNYDQNLVGQLMWERNQALIQRDVVDNQLRITREVLEKEKEITRKRFERRNICSGTVELWNVALVMTIFLSSCLAGMLTWYYNGYDQALGIIVAVCGLIVIAPSMVILRQYLSHHYRINGALAD